MSFFSELRRRNVFRVAATYAISMWLIIQVVSAVNAPLNLPPWFETVVVVLLAIGFPIAILLAWAFDLTPDGLRVTQPESEQAAQSGERKLDYVLIAALAGVALITVWDKMPSLEKAPELAPESVVQEQSIAVLPFADMSPAGDQAYFGFGIAEELLNELTRLDGLRVAGRTSSFAYQDGAGDLRAIGAALNVGTILEGSVRRDGDRIRITAQLINTDDGYHLWSETYDREFTDIFAIQEDIAASVAGSLGVRLGVGGVNAFRGAGTSSVEAYETYLRAMRSPVATGPEGRIPLLERAIELDPDYAAGWAALGLTIGASMWRHAPEDAPEILDRAMPVLLRAVELAPESAYAHRLLATVGYARMDWIRSENSYQEALSLLPDHGNLESYANMLMRSGRHRAAATRYGQADEQRREFKGGNLRLNVYLAQSEFDEAENIANSMDSDQQRAHFRVLIALNEGDSNDLRLALEALDSNLPARQAFHVRVLAVFDSPESVLSTLRSTHNDSSLKWASKYHDIALLAAFFGDPEFAFQVFSIEARLTTVRFGALWYPVMSDVRKLPEFWQLARDVNLDVYWREYGWSDACQAVDDVEFVCQ